MKTKRIKRLGTTGTITLIEKHGPVSLVTLEYDSGMTEWQVTGPHHFGQTMCWVQPDEATARRFAQRLLLALLHSNTKLPAKVIRKIDQCFIGFK